MKKDFWLEVVAELQDLAQAGLAYGKDKFDIERFQRIRDISAEIMSRKSELNLDTIKDLFCTEKGYPTPKMDCRAAIFKDGKILLVRELEDGKWTLPGGWIDSNKSVRENVIKEVKEESGLDVDAKRLIALLDRNRYNTPIFPYGVCKVFVLCNIIGGNFTPNIEISESGYFSFEELPPLSPTRITEGQIKMCFDANLDENWKVLFD